MRKLSLILVLAMLPLAVWCQDVTIHAANQPAATVFRSIMEQTGKNFVYPSELLHGVNVTVNARQKPLKKVLDEMFRDTGIIFKIKGRNVILKQKPSHTRKNVKATEIRQPVLHVISDTALTLQEVVVVSRLEAPAVETTEIGARKITATEIRNTPVMMGESDVLKSLQTEPGVTEGQEGMAGMNVHGGNADENLCMLDNVPLYNVNHFAGLFSAFNVDAIRYIDFFKSSIPAKYDGRLSSFLDVRTKNGSPDRHNGSFKLGLTSGAFAMDGPIGSRTTYSVALRRSWFDMLSIPLVAIANAGTDEKIRFRYAFMDANAKITHRFSNRATGFASIYFGDDLLKTGSKDKQEGDYGWFEDDRFDMHWGNLLAQAGLNYRLNQSVSAEFTAAYTRFFSSMRHDYLTKEMSPGHLLESQASTNTHNNINDWIFRGDLYWQPDDANRVRFGAAYTWHSFLPARTSRHYTTESTVVATRDSTWAYKASEANIYMEDDIRISDLLSANAGVHASLFSISGKTHVNLDPRVSASYRPHSQWAFKGAYSRTSQYVHQLAQTYLALPTDQWIPVTGRFKPQNADKIAVGAYWQATDGRFTAALEGYYKWMRNLIDYRDEYYLQPPLETWTHRLCSGKGTAKGLDLKIEKTSGKITGHVAYSLAWADRTFADKNGGATFPARFDHRHTINILANWHISDKVQLSALWTGHSGNRFTLLSQVWDSPYFEPSSFGPDDGSPLKARVNNYQLPFYHRLDLSLTVRNRHGYWNFSLYNAYSHMNTIAIRRTWREQRVHTPDGVATVSKPVFQKVKLLPIIPSFSYTWIF